MRTYPSSAGLPPEDQLAWMLAAVATDPVPVSGEVTEIVINRVIDDAAVAAAALARAPARAAREQALRHPGRPGATVFGARRAGVTGVGGLGERRRGAGARLPRHRPSRRPVSLNGW